MKKPKDMVNGIYHDKENECWGLLINGVWMMISVYESDCISAGIELNVSGVLN